MFRHAGVRDSPLIRMRRHPAHNSGSSSINSRRRSPLLLCGLALLLYVLYRVYSLHGDLGELHESLDRQQGGAAPAPAADVQVIMPEDADTLFINATSKDISKILAYPHVDECRQCSVCVPQSFIDNQLGNGSSSGKSRWWWSRIWSRQLLQQQQWGEQEEDDDWQQHQQEQQQQQEEGNESVGNQLKSMLLGRQSDAANTQVPSQSSSSSDSKNGTSSSSSSRRKGQRESWLQRRQQWLAALTAAAAAVVDSASSAQNNKTSDTSFVQHNQQQQQQQYHRRRRLQQQAPGRQRLDGVQTHKAWLAKQAAGEANTDTHAVPGIQVILDMPDNSFEWQGVRYHIGPSTLQIDQNKIRHCKVCRGCKQALTPMPKGIQWMGGSFLHDPGASDGWISTAEAPTSTSSRSSNARQAAATKRSVVKVWCVPVPKPGSRVPAVCKPSAIREQLQLVLALQNIAQDCQLGDLLPRHWVGPVDGILPNSSGYRVAWDGLWADLVVGVSAENLVHRGDPQVDPPLLLNYLQNKLNSTQVMLAAIFDLLFSQCDRHGQNLYLQPDGSLVLIDNDQSYGASWRPCGVDSLFLPGTQKFEIERLGFSYVMKKPEYAPPKAPSKHLDPLALLDYRCHLPDGKTALGTHYPKQVSQCLKRLSKMSPEKIAAKYGYPHPRMAEAVHQRSKDMLDKGFEWTLQNGWPYNPIPTRYKWAKGCCKMKRRQHDDSIDSSSSSSSSSSDLPPSGAGAGSKGSYECTSWVQTEHGWPTDLPIGDPVSGLAWEHNGVDSGSYDLTDPADQAPLGPIH